MTRHWTLAQASKFCAELDAVVRPLGFGVGICGSVLHKGKSAKDLDVIILPLSTTAVQSCVPGFWGPALTTLRTAFSAFGLELYVDRWRVKAKWRKQGSLDEKHVEVWKYKGKRVDIFYLT